MKKMGTDFCSITPATHQVPDLVSRKSKSENTIVEVNGIPIGGKEVIIMAGPCAV